MKHPAQTKLRGCKIDDVGLTAKRTTTGSPQSFVSTRECSDIDGAMLSAVMMKRMLIKLRVPAVRRQALEA